MPVIDPSLTDAEVTEISGTSEANLTPFIETAELLMTAHFSDSALEPALLRKIATYLAAHFAFLKEGQIKAEKIGPSSTTFNLQSGLGLLSTSFGQQALALDSSGKLGRLNAEGSEGKKSGGCVDVF